MSKAVAGKVKKSGGKSRVKKTDNPPCAAPHLRHEALGAQLQDRADTETPGAQRPEDHNDLSAHDNRELEAERETARLISWKLVEEYKRKKERYILKLESLISSESTDRQLVLIYKTCSDLMDSVVKSFKLIYHDDPILEALDGIEALTEEELDQKILELHEKIDFAAIEKRQKISEDSPVGKITRFEGTDD